MSYTVTSIACLSQPLMFVSFSINLLQYIMFLMHVIMLLLFQFIFRLSGLPSPTNQPVFFTKQLYTLQIFWAYTSLISNLFLLTIQNIILYVVIVPYYHSFTWQLQFFNKFYWRFYSWIHIVFIFLSLTIFNPLLHFLSYTDCAELIVPFAVYHFSF